MRLTQAKLRSVLHYDPVTGIFTYLVRRGFRVKVGDVAGALSSNGYVRLSVNYRRYYGQRLAWLYMTGEWPRRQVDHKNTIRSDNRWTNLRPATNRLNNENRRAAHSSNITGFLGAGPTRNGNYRARIYARGRERHLGVFDTPEQAHAAYVAAKRQLHRGCTL